MSGARFIAQILSDHAAGQLSLGRRAWAEPMRQEVDSIENDWAALRWAVGCVAASYSERITAMSTASLSPLFSMVALVFFLFGGYFLASGNFEVILEALPHTLITVVLGALATTWILTTVGGRGVFRAIKQALRGRCFQRGDYRELADVLMAELSAPGTASTLRRDDPFLRHDGAVHMIQDAKALIEIDPAQLGAILQARIGAIHATEKRAVQVLRAMSSNLLWFGALFVILGGVNFLLEFTQAPEVIGGMMASAMIGPLVGFLLAAGFFRPLASRLEASLADDANFYDIIRTAFLCRRSGSDAAVAVRTAYGALPPELGPGEDNADAPGLPRAALH
jgi:flagellar motor component MotA